MHRKIPALLVALGVSIAPCFILPVLAQPTVETKESEKQIESASKEATEQIENAIKEADKIENQAKKLEEKVEKRVQKERLEDCKEINVLKVRDEKTIIPEDGPSVYPVLLKGLPNRPTVALVLGGGGLRGTAHIGVIRELERNNVPIDLVVGTSIGSIIGGLYCAGTSPDKLESESPKRLIRAYYTSPLFFEVMKLPFKMLTFRNMTGIYKSNKMMRALNTFVPTSKLEISEYKPKFAAMSVDLLRGAPVAITDGNLGEALAASAAVPFLKRPIFTERGLMVDGGILRNIPVSPAKAMGAEFVIAVDINDEIKPMSKKHFQRKFGSITSRLVRLAQHDMESIELKQADVVIRPELSGIGMLSKKIKDADRAVRAGEVATDNVMDDIKSKYKAACIPYQKSAAQKLVQDQN